MLDTNGSSPIHRSNDWSTLQFSQGKNGWRSDTGNWREERIQALLGDVTRLAGRNHHVRASKIDAPHEARITGFGACEEVGRSAFFLELSGLKILLDCGSGFGPEEAPPITREQIRALDFVMLSHAHTDHACLLPWLYRQGCSAQLLGLEPAFAFSRLLQEDALKVREKYRDEKPLYDHEDMRETLVNACCLRLGHSYKLRDGTQMTLYNAGHLPGSAMLLFEDRETILYSGDIALRDSRLLRRGAFPSKVDTLIVESTYGDRVHENRQDTEKQFLKRILSALDSGGTVILPVFALGRAQEILLTLASHPQLGHGKRYPVYIDGMVRDMNALNAFYMNSREDYGFSPELKQLGARFFSESESFFRPVVNRHSMLQRKDPKIIVTTSGMGEGLATLYISAFRKNPKNLAIFVGYQTEGTVGRRLVDGERVIEVNGEERKLHLQIERMNFSAHADQQQIIEALRGMDLKRLILIHGEPTSLLALKREAAKVLPNTQIIIPKLNEQIDLFNRAA